MTTGESFGEDTAERELRGELDSRGRVLRLMGEVALVLDIDADQVVKSLDRQLEDMNDTAIDLTAVHLTGFLNILVSPDLRRQTNLVYEPRDENLQAKFEKIITDEDFKSDAEIVAPQSITPELKVADSKISVRGNRLLQTIFGDISEFDISREDYDCVAETLHFLYYKYDNKLDDNRSIKIDSFKTRIEGLLTGLKDKEISENVGASRGAISVFFNKLHKDINAAAARNTKQPTEYLKENLTAFRNNQKLPVAASVNEISYAESEVAELFEDEAPDSNLAMEQAHSRPVSKEGKMMPAVGRLRAHVRSEARKMGLDVVISENVFSDDELVSLVEATIASRLPDADAGDLASRFAVGNLNLTNPIEQAIGLGVAKWIADDLKKEADSLRRNAQSHTPNFNTPKPSPLGPLKVTPPSQSALEAWPDEDPVVSEYEHPDEAATDESERKLTRDELMAELAQTISLTFEESEALRQRITHDKQDGTHRRMSEHTASALAKLNRLYYQRAEDIFDSQKHGDFTRVIGQLTSLLQPMDIDQIAKKLSRNGVRPGKVESIAWEAIKRLI